MSFILKFASKIGLFKRFFLILIWPSKNVDYFNLFVEIRNKILTDLKSAKIMNAFNYLLISKIVHFVCLAFIGERMNEWQRFLHYDGMHFIIRSPYLNFMSALATVLSAYLNEAVLKGTYSRLINFLTTILFNNKETFFLSKRINGQTIQERAKYIFVQTLNSQHGFMVVVGKDILLYR